MASLDATKTSVIADHEFLALKDGGWAAVQQMGNSIQYETFGAKGKSNGDATALIAADSTLDHIEFRGADRNKFGDTYVLFTARDKETGVLGLYSQVFDKHIDSYDKPLLLIDDGQVPEGNEYSQVNALGNGRFVASWDHSIRVGDMSLHYAYGSIQDADGDVLTRYPMGGSPYNGAGDMDIAAVGAGKFVRVNQEDRNVYLNLMTISPEKNPDGTYDLDSVTFKRAESPDFQYPYHRNVSVCGLMDSNFIVTYEFFDKKSGLSTLFQRVFDQNAEAINLGLFEESTDAFVSTNNSLHQSDADTVGLANGGWATAWRQGFDDSKMHDIYLKAYDSRGYGQSLDIKINTDAGDCRAPEITALSNGNVLVSWTQHGHLQQHVVDLPGNTLYGKDERAAYGDRIVGTGEREKIFGLEGYDTLEGHGGDDVIDGGAGTDTMRGGRGNDTYLVDETGDTIIEGTDNGNDTVRTLVSLSLEHILHVENIKLLGELDLDAGGNSLDNHLIGNSGNNILTGEDGDDLLAGRRGFDTLTGGKGADIFVFRPGDDRDTITDFDLGQDKIDLSSFSKIQSIDDLAISQNDHGDLVIDFSHGDRIVLEGIEQLSEKQFLFAA